MPPTSNNPFARPSPWGKAPASVSRLRPPPGAAVPAAAPRGPAAAAAAQVETAEPAAEAAPTAPKPRGIPAVMPTQPLQVSTARAASGPSQRFFGGSLVPPKADPPKAAPLAPSGDFLTAPNPRLRVVRPEPAAEPAPEGAPLRFAPAAVRPPEAAAPAPRPAPTARSAPGPQAAPEPAPAPRPTLAAKSAPRPQPAPEPSAPAPKPPVVRHTPVREPVLAASRPAALAAATSAATGTTTGAVKPVPAAPRRGRVGLVAAGVVVGLAGMGGFYAWSQREAPASLYAASAVSPPASPAPTFASDLSVGELTAAPEAPRRRWRPRRAAPAPVAAEVAPVPVEIAPAPEPLVVEPALPPPPAAIAPPTDPELPMITGSSELTAPAA